MTDYATTFVFTDNPMISGVSECDPDIVNDNLMYLKAQTDGLNSEKGQVIQQVQPSSETKFFSLLFGAGNSATQGFTPEEEIGATNTTQSLYVQPSTGTIYATNFNGLATQATADSSGNNIINTYETKANVALKQDIAPVVNILADGGSVSLSDNSINRVTLTAGITFVLPTISEADNSKLHQILVQLKMSAVYSINVGTTMYFNNQAPDLSSAGRYNLIFEYDGSNWICGCIEKGAGS